MGYLYFKPGKSLIGAIGWGLQGATSGMEGAKEQIVQESKNSTLPSQDEEAAIKKKYGGIIPKKPPLISKDHERAYFDSADWALGKQQGVEKPKGPLEALRPKLQPTQQQTRYRKSPCAPADGAGGGSAQPEGGTADK
ncbi:hypothetical protein E1A91_D13G063500v1 [Gossypium mustelinum]|uniref:cAMP-regulated phosphoprotein 19-related protein n=2 Tax=Gossypium mustelinum TaxID=34275 RepID=A0A5D2RY18_GOSMU|nr:hypothetical protein E1A91_D13G063500v1 [Gossypium mustelinum]